MPDDTMNGQEGPTPRDVIEWRQARLIRDAIPDAAFSPPDWDEQRHGADVIYRRSALLVRVWHEADVRAALPRLVPGIEPFERLPGGWDRPPLERDPANFDEVTGSLARITWRGGDENGSVLEAVSRLEDRFGAGVARPEHLTYVCGHACAADEPEVVPGTATPEPPVQTGPAALDPTCGRGAGVRVLVMDNGLWPGAANEHPWLSGVTGDVDSGDSNDLGQDSGHGTFTAGCLRVTAPEATVHVHNAAIALPGPGSGPVGAQWETALANQVRAGLAVQVPHVLVLNFAAATHGGRSMLAFDTLYDDVICHLKQLKIFCPAGNDGQALGLWPASYAWVVSVGALAANWLDRAPWSNSGPTVDLYAPGDRLVNAYARGRYLTKWTDAPEERLFDGMARWGGTSFATPLVAGLVAARMSRTGQSSSLAYADLLRLAQRQARAGVGPVLYPGQACKA